MRYLATPVAARVETTEGRHLVCRRAGGRAVLRGAVLHDERVADAHVRPEVQRRQAQRGQRPVIATLVATGTCLSSDARAGTLPCFLLTSSSDSLADPGTLTQGPSNTWSDGEGSKGLHYDGCT